MTKKGIRNRMIFCRNYFFCLIFDTKIYLVFFELILDFYKRSNVILPQIVKRNKIQSRKE